MDLDNLADSQIKWRSIHFSLDELNEGHLFSNLVDEISGSEAGSLAVREQKDKFQREGVGGVTGMRRRKQVQGYLKSFHLNLHKNEPKDRMLTQSVHMSTELLGV